MLCTFCRIMGSLWCQYALLPEAHSSQNISYSMYNGGGGGGWGWGWGVGGWVGGWVGGGGVPDDTAAFASYTADWRCNVCGISTIYLRLGSSEGSLYLEGRSAMVSQDPTSEQQT